MTSIEKGVTLDAGKNTRVTFSYDIPEGTKRIIPIVEGCSWGTLSVLQTDNIMSGSVTAAFLNITTVRHSLTGQIRFIFLG